MQINTIQQKHEQERLQTIKPIELNDEQVMIPPNSDRALGAVLSPHMGSGQTSTQPMQFEALT